MSLMSTRERRPPKLAGDSGSPTKGGATPPHRRSSPSEAVRKAFLEGLAPDGGLYLPTRIPRLELNELLHLRGASFQEVARYVGPRLLEELLPRETVESVVDEALDFPVPLIRLDRSTYVLELFHGPTGAFKDVGARFLARLLARSVRRTGERIVVLVATSGDTGGAVARAVHGIPGVDALVVYPEGRLTPLQLLHITRLPNGGGDGDVHPVAVRGSFDDCQAMVKAVLREGSPRTGLTLTSANSVNLGRLLPQVFYYVSGWIELAEYLVEGSPTEAELPHPWVSVPSGNLGNLTAGLLARRMGVPFSGFVAATNDNAALRTYLEREELPEGEAVTTHSNAMDVARPSNLERLLALAGGDRRTLGREVVATSHDDASTLEAMGHLHRRHGYLVDPHTAVGWLGLEEVRRRGAEGGRYMPEPGIVAATADPAKFAHVVRQATGEEPPVRPAWRREDAGAEGEMVEPIRVDPDPAVLRDLIARL